MRIKLKNATKPRGFTLIELLTVIAIIAVLATLISSSISSAKKQARKAACISNLRQVALGFTLYFDDYQARPASFRSMADNKYLTSGVLTCPEDRTAGKNWAGLVLSAQFAGPPLPGSDFGKLEQDRSHSYFESFTWDEASWSRVQKDPMGGVAACQLHGIGRPDWEHPSTQQLQGLVLRALKDGSVIGRKIFWETQSTKDNIGGGTPSAIAPGLESEFQFLVDPVE